MTITDDEREAREWLKHAEHFEYLDDEDAKHRATILALLDAPRMPRPEDVPASVMVPIADRFGFPYADFRCLYRALYDHYTAPPPKVEAWCVMWPDNYISVHADEAQAKRNAEGNPKARIVKLVEARDGE